ncbi:hypothetical protein [Cyclobacterium sp. SYSU L10401]|uniref:hypothetical protein n=1 Tax=Cyclobacterium sp. SYSU L10401 TaxID=2678657 RepID=UPI0013D0757A|nr:hypothetical protein [Cyclobacterium sp. SYSU L10401]
MAASENYLKGFNHGYFLQKYEPDLLHDILKTPQVDHDYVAGLTDGKSELDKEVLKETGRENINDLKDPFEKRLNAQEDKNIPTNDKGFDKDER